MKKLTAFLLITLVCFISQAQSIAAFTASQTKGCAPLTVDFIDSSQGTPISVEWNMDDGTTYDVANVQHTFSDTGTYHVTFTVNDSFTSDTETIDIYVYSINTNFYNNSGFALCPPFVVQFQNTSTPQGLTYNWQFGDGETDTAAEPLHVYFMPGTYDVTLYAQDASGCTDSLTINDTVSVQGPLLQAVIDTNAGVVPFTIHLSAQVQNTMQIELNWGDGHISTTIDSVHTYNTANTFQITVALVDSTGCNVPYIIDTIKTSYALTINKSVPPIKVAVYPNPFTNEIFISVPQDFGGQITITNLMGQVVYDSQLIGNKIKLSDALPKGQYILYLKNTTGNYQSIITKR